MGTPDGATQRQDPTATPDANATGLTPAVSRGRALRYALGMSDTISSPQWQPAPGAAIRRAATVVVLRDPGDGMQVLLMRRNARAGDIHSGACVFPGGLVEAADRDAHRSEERRVGKECW